MLGADMLCCFIESVPSHMQKKVQARKDIFGSLLRGCCFFWHMQKWEGMDVQLSCILYSGLLFLPGAIRFLRIEEAAYPDSG